MRAKVFFSCLMEPEQLPRKEGLQVAAQEHKWLNAQGIALDHGAQHVWHPDTFLLVSSHDIRHMQLHARVDCIAA